jgi:hypothetical protein
MNTKLHALAAVSDEACIYAVGGWEDGSPALSLALSVARARSLSFSLFLFLSISLARSIARSIARSRALSLAFALSLALALSLFITNNMKNAFFIVWVGVWCVYKLIIIPIVTIITEKVKFIGHLYIYI